MQGRHARGAGACEGSLGDLRVILSPEALGNFSQKVWGGDCLRAPPLSRLCLLVTHTVSRP